MDSLISSQPENEFQYAVAPIIDAIIELRFQDELSDNDRERASKKFAQRYPIVDEVVQQRIEVEVNPERIATNLVILERMSKRTHTDLPHIIQIGGHILSVATGAPYEGWSNLFDRFVSDWAVAKKLWGYRTIQRIGVRFINRIDLAPNEDGTVDYEHYLNLRINLPEDFPPTLGYSLMFRTNLEEIKCGVIVRSEVAPPAVPGRQSFTLDLDVSRDIDLPQKEVAVFELLEEMRKAKNALFETFITDKARELFNAR